MSLERELPIVNWPTKSGEFKVAQLDLDGKPYLRFEEEELGSHSFILVEFLTSLGIKYREVKPKKDSLPVPALEGDRYKVYGMGLSRVNVEQKQASFYGTSIGYGIGIDQKHLDSIRLLVKDWKLI